ncbi:MAG: hypothetical protein ACREV1_19475 [Gammaproteobacteria bacterium]
MPRPRLTSNHPIALAAVLHDTLEDTDTLPGELKREFGTQIAETVREVSNDKTLSKIERKCLQIQPAPALGQSSRRPPSRNS